jgi:bifunctional DNA-binding transcriptional regulator/antitoxin component of YhaV-PrlF toxin-antitoxin module
VQTAVTKRGQTVIPASLRKRYQIDESTRLVWIDDGEIIRVIPIPGDLVEALRGRGRGEKLFEKIQADRREEMQNE